MVALLFYIEEKFYNFNTYLILFCTLPFVYLTSFLFIRNIDTYIPKKIIKKDIINFFDFSKYKFWHFYFLSNWIDFWLANVINIWAGIFLLKTEMSIWLFNSILTLISVFLLIYLSHRREEKNRLKYFFYLTILMSGLYMYFWFYFSLISYIIFSLILLLIRPMFRVSEHVYDLSMMDNIKTWESDFFPAMLFREVILWIWRTIGLVLLLLVYYFSWMTPDNILRLWLFLIWIVLLSSFLGVLLWDKYEKDKF